MNEDRAVIKPAQISGRRHSRGFTLIELAVVLVVIGLIVSAVTIGRDLVRNSGYERIASQFVQGWSTAFDNYYVATGGVPGDSVTNPTGQVPMTKVNGKITGLCGDKLRNAFLKAGVAMPGGRAADKPDHYGYEDTHGIPHDLTVCMASVKWSDPGASVGNYVLHQHNVLQVKGMTPSLARYLDHFFDGRTDARFGRFRLSTKAASTSSTESDWPLNETAAYNSSANNTGSDITQSAEEDGDLLLSR